MAYATSTSIMGAHCAGEYSSPFEIDFSASLVAEVGNPRKFGVEVKRAIRGKVGSYVLYSVITRTAITEDDGFVIAGEIVNEVDRRYSDFDWLMNTLTKRYSGLIIGTMPEKRLIDSATEAIIGERVSGLTNFLNEVLQNPYLEDDVTVKNFLTMDKDEWDSYKDVPELAKTELMLKCPGLSEWHSFLDTLKQNRNSEAALGTVKSEFTDQVENITQVLFSSNEAHTSAEKLLAVSEKFSQAAQAIVELNGQFDSQLDSGFGPKKNVDKTKSSMNASSRCLQAAAKAVHESGHMRLKAAGTFATIGTCAKHDRLTMLTVMDILKQREQLTKKHEAKREDRMRKDLLYKQLKAKDRFEEAQKLEQALEQIKTELADEVDGMASQAKGILASELRRYSNRRFFEFRRRAAHFATQRVQEADEAIEHWQKLLKRLRVDQEHMCDLSAEALLHDRLPTLDYYVDPRLDTTRRDGDDDEDEDEAEEEEEEEEEDKEEVGGDDDDDDDDWRGDEVGSGDDDDEQMGLGGGDYDEDGGESQEDEL